MPLLFVAIALVAATTSAVRAAEPADLPQVIPDASVGAWVVERFAGNTTAGAAFFQGPTREVGGLGRPGACLLPDGRVLVAFREGIAEVDAAGDLRLVSGARALYGTTGQVNAGVLAYNPVDKHVYLAGANCVRRLVEVADGPWKVEIVAGTPGKAGYDDGPAVAATFTRVDSIAINGRGTIFVLDFNQRLRQIGNGAVTTLNAGVRGGRADGPLEQAKFAMIGLGGNLCGGEDDDTLYLSDHWNFCVRRIDLKGRTVTTVAGMPRPAGAAAARTPQGKRYNANSDGPALTWASFNSGCAVVCWDPVHKALWCGGPDENRGRWLKDGEVRTVLGAGKQDDKWPQDALGVPAPGVKMSWNSIVGVDAQGRAYIGFSGNPTGLWRAYPRAEVKP